MEGELKRATIYARTLLQWSKNIWGMHGIRCQLIILMVSLSALQLSVIVIRHKKVTKDSAPLS